MGKNLICVKGEGNVQGHVLRGSGGLVPISAYIVDYDIPDAFNRAAAA
jgi:hypothetical protein